MSKLFVANATPQNWIIFYRLDFNDDGSPNVRFTPAKQHPIPSGKQNAIGGDLHISQVESIVKQLSKYGAIGVTDVQRQRVYTPLVFNVDKPVPAVIIERVRALNMGVLAQEGAERRRKAAVANNQAIETAVQNAVANLGGDPNEVKIPGVETTFEQVEQTPAGEKTIAEGVRVTDAVAPGRVFKGRVTASPKRGLGRRRAAG